MTDFLRIIMLELCAMASSVSNTWEMPSVPWLFGILRRGEIICISVDLWTALGKKKSEVKYQNEAKGELHTWTNYCSCDAHRRTAGILLDLLTPLWSILLIHPTYTEFLLISWMTGTTLAPLHFRTHRKANAAGMWVWPACIQSVRHFAFVTAN